jgi:release factor glutamine methyltransferase
LAKGAIVRIADALREATIRLAESSDTSRLDAELLMAHAVGVTRGELLLRHLRDELPQGFARLLDRRLAHEPIAYITGVQEFYGLAFRVGPAVLIPRADSETLVAAALAAKPQARRVLDCGTGSGALLLAVLAELPDAAGVGIDRSAEAVAIARSNAAALGLAERAAMLRADWWEDGWSAATGGAFDLILTNPPYVEDAAALAPSVREYEPAGALFAGSDGLDDYRRLIPQLRALMAPGGVALVEIGATQADAVGAIAAAAGFTVAFHHDLGGRPRVLELSPIR